MRNIQTLSVWGQCHSSRYPHENDTRGKGESGMGRRLPRTAVHRVSLANIKNDASEEILELSERRLDDGHDLMNGTN
ncbi:hypothetical protein [Novipirellula aureliae]|nr:hypothetical protein [Novipirellula aureliae]